MRKKLMKCAVSIIVSMLSLYVFALSAFAQTIPTPWTWPITSDYGPRVRPTPTSTWFHEGIDYRGPNGADILAVEGGNIKFIGGNTVYRIDIEIGTNIWQYLHMFSDGALPRDSGDHWQLANVSLRNPISGSQVQSAVIIYWQDLSHTVAQKVLCMSDYDGYIALINGNPVAQGSVSTSEAIGPVGTSGIGTGAHLHLQLNVGIDNPLFYLIHTPDGQPTLTIEQPDENHIFEGAELTSAYSIRADINSTAGPDVNQVTFLIYRNTDSSQIVYLPGAPGVPTFSYTGTVGEYDTSWNLLVLVGSDGNTTGVQPYQVAGDSLGHDKFIYQQNFSELNLPSGEHTLVVLVTDVNGNSILSGPRHFTISSLPIVISTSPANGATDISSSSPIIINFSNEMNPSVSEAAISIYPALVAPSYAWSDGNKTLTITDSNGLVGNATYVVMISDAAMDIIGTHLDGDKDGQPGGNYTFTFTTATNPETQKKCIITPGGGIIDGSQWWVGGGTLSFTVQVVDDNGNAVPTSTPPQIISSSGTVNFTYPGTPTSTWAGTVTIGGGDGQVTFSSTSCESLTGNTSFMIDTTPPTLEVVAVAPPACSCPNGPIAVQFNVTDSGSGVASVVPAGLGFYVNGCFPPGEYEYGAASVTDKVGNTASYVYSIVIPDPPGCDNPDDNFSVSGSSLLSSASNDQFSGIAVYQGGYYYDFLGEMAQINRSTMSITDKNLAGTLIGTSRLLVVPSGGLYGLKNSEMFKTELDEFVKQGGTLVVFAQQHGYDFSALPVPQESDGTYRKVSGFGWGEDQSCQYNSSYIDTWHQMLSGQSKATPSLNVDGYFSNYPSNAAVILRRSLNGQPSLITYNYGNGLVIATTMYSDYAFGYGQASDDEKALVRDLISWAKAPAHLPEVKPADAVSIPLQVLATNATSMNAVSVKIRFLDPNRTTVLSEQTTAASIPAGQTMTIPVSFASAATALGIYHTDYILMDAQGKVLQPQREADSGRFVVSNPPGNTTKSTDYNFSATTNTEKAYYGSDVLFTVHVWNNTDRDRTITAKYVFPHQYIYTGDPSYGVFKWSYEPWADDQWLVNTVMVRASGTAEFDHLMKNIIHDEFIAVHFYDENNTFIGGISKGVWMVYPSVNVDVKTDKSLYRKGETVNLNLNLQNTQGSINTTTLKVRVMDPSNIAVYNTSLNITLAKGTNIQSLSFGLPSTALSGVYAVSAEVYDMSGKKIGGNVTSFELPKSMLSVLPIIPSDLCANGIVSLVIKNTGIFNVSSAQLTTSFKSPAGEVIQSDVKQIQSLDPGQSTTVDLSLPCANLIFGNYKLIYALTYGGETRNGEIIISNTPVIVASLDKLSYRERETADLMVKLSNAGRYNLSNLTLSVSVPDAGFADAKTVALPVGTFLPELHFAIPVPTTILPGQHHVDIFLSLPSGSMIVQSQTLTVPESSLTIGYTGPSAVAAGDTIILSIENTGGVDAAAQYQLRLYDSKSALIAQSSDIQTVPAGSSLPLDLAIPSEAAEGAYIFLIDYTNTTSGKSDIVEKLLTISGVKGTVTIRTDKESYLATENITVSSSISNTGAAIQSGNLHLSIQQASGALYQAQWDNAWKSASNYQIDISSNPGDVKLRKIIPNGDFELGNTNGWVASNIYGGAAGVVKEGTRFSALPTENIIMEGSYAGIIRSNSAGYPGSWGILTSDLFVPIQSVIKWAQLSESQNVYLEYRILDMNNNVLKTASLPIVTSSWGAQQVDIQEYIGQPISIEFRQHTTESGSGYFTLVDNIRNNDAVYSLSGYLESETKDFGVPVAFEKINWAASSPAGSSIKFQIAANNDNSTWNYSGSDGTADTYYESSGSIINTVVNGNRYLRWKAFLNTSDTTVTPILHNLSIQASGIAGQLLWQEDVPVNLGTNVTQNFSTSIGSLSATGKMYLQGALTSGTGQTITFAEYPFYIVVGNTVLVFGTDKKVYKPGETVTIKGRIENRTTVDAVGLKVVLSAQSGSQDSQQIYTMTVDIPAGGNYPFTTTTTADVEGIVTMNGVVTQNTSTLVEMSDHYEVSKPTVIATVTAPDVAGNEPFVINVEIKNFGPIDGSITVTPSFNVSPETVTIAAGESRILQFGRQISSSTRDVFTITGDLNQTITKTINYGLGVAIMAGDGSQGPNVNPEGMIAIPIAISNNGMMDETVTIGYVLNRSSAVVAQQAKTYFVQKGTSISDTLYYELTEGSYQLSAASQMPAASSTTNVTVLKSEKAEMSLSVGTQGNGLIPVAINLTNIGYNNLEGTLQLSILDSQGKLVWSGEQTITQLTTNSAQLVTSNINIAGITPGNYTISATLLVNSGEQLAANSASLMVQGAVFQITQVPAYQTYYPDQEATFTFKIKNVGNQEESIDLAFKAYDLIDSTRTEWLKPGEEKDISFAFIMPADLEEKDYFADYTLSPAHSQGGEGVVKGQAKYHLAGINLTVVASLDKQNYIAGDTAHLTLTISQQSAVVGENLFARINYSGYEEQRPFILNNSQTLVFDIPLTQITGEKLLYGIYYAGGRSIHLNNIYVYKADDSLTITTDKQVYDPGNVVTLEISSQTPGISGQMTLTGPSYAETFAFNGSATKSFTLPMTMTAGTYKISAQLKPQNSQPITASYPIDVNGTKVKIIEVNLDKGKYAETDSITANLTMTSNQDVAGTLKMWVVDPQGKRTPAGETSLMLSSSEPLLIKHHAPLVTEVSGIHRLVYQVYAGDLLVSAGSEAFDVGDAALLGLSTDKVIYPTNTEVITAKANIFGTMDATLELKIDGTSVRTEPVSLNGFTTLNLELEPVQPGTHVLKAILTAGGLTSTGEINFVYGSNLPDLAVAVGGQIGLPKNGMLDISVSVMNYGKSVAAPTTVALYDGESLVEIKAVGELSEGGLETVLFSWDVIGKAGDHTLNAVVDPQNTVAEFNDNNNTASANIHVPSDTMPPVTSLTVGTPKYEMNGAIIVSSNTLFTLSAADDNSGVAMSEYRIDNAAWIAYTAFSITSEGTHTIDYRSQDNSGNVEDFRSISVVVDAAPPSGSIAINNGSLYTNDPSVTLALSCTDALSGCAQMQFSNDNTTWTMTEAYSSTKAWVFDSGDGPKTVYVKYTDGVGNPSSAYSAGITLDTIPPMAVITGATASPTRETGVLLTVRGSDVVAYKFQLDTGIFSAETNISTPIALTGLADGTHNVFVVGKDSAGNWQKDEHATILSWIVDNTSPIMTLSTLPDGSYTNNATLNVAGTVTDNIGVSGVTINDTAITPNTDGSFSHAVSLITGPNTATTIAEDLAGNRTTDIRTIILDQTAPNLVILTPADNSITDKAETLLTGAVDAASTVIVKNNTGNPVPALVTDGTFTLPVTLEYDQNTIMVSATDLANNTSTAHRTVTFDNISPALAVTNPSQDITTSQSGILLQGTVADLTITEVTITCDGATFTPALTNGTFEQQLTFSTEKTYAIVVTATDGAGNTSTIQRNIIYAPIVSYRFEGFFNPVDNPPFINTANAGQAIPIKWRLTDTNGSTVSDTTSFKSLTSYLVTCDSLAGNPADAIEEYAAGSSGLQYLGSGNWQFNWKTANTYAKQCRSMVLTLGDNSTHTAHFKFK